MLLALDVSRHLENSAIGEEGKREKNSAYHIENR